MSDGRALISYQYDGSFDGMLSCVFESFVRHENPTDIFPEDAPQFTLCPIRFVPTNERHAKRVAVSIPVKISRQAADWVKKGFLSCAEHRELLLLRFLRLGYQKGSAVTRMLQQETVSELFHAVQFIENESHLLKGFLRFSERGGILTAVIDPKNMVLPLIAPHFADRMPRETFLIYDRTHEMAVFYQNRQMQIFPAGEILFEPENDTELLYQQLWKQFYRTIAIEGRYNPKCRQTHCPKRYWQNMTELCGEVLGNSARNPLKKASDSIIMEETARQNLPERTENHDLYFKS